jgi:hypothetical protein
LVAHSIGALNVETYCKASRGASALDVISLLQKKVLLRSGQKPMTQRSDHSQVLFGTLFPEANVHSDGVKACRLVPRKLGQEGWVVRSQWQAGMVIPNGHSVNQLSSSGKSGFSHEQVDIKCSTLRQVGSDLLGFGKEFLGDSTVCSKNEKDRQFCLRPSILTANGTAPLRKMDVPSASLATWFAPFMSHPTGAV